MAHVLRVFQRPDPWRWAFSLSVAIFASPVILDFRLRSWPGSLGDLKGRLGVCSKDGSLAKLFFMGLQIHISSYLFFSRCGGIIWYNDV